MGRGKEVENFNKKERMKETKKERIEKNLECSQALCWSFKMVVVDFL